MGTLSKYRVELRGENYLLKNVDKKNKCGFYTGVIVEAKNPDSAFSKAIDIIRNQKSLNSKILNSKDDSPKIYLEEIFELEPNTKPEKNLGKVFFIEKNNPDSHGEKYFIMKRWWEFWK